MERTFHLLFFSGLCLFIQNISCAYILIPEQKTWNEAQAYCRQNHIDLATVQSNEDWTNVKEAVGPTLASPSWIGLYNDINSWRWSYKDKNITLLFWSNGQPGNNNRREECAVMRNGTWSDVSCDNIIEFFCYNENGANRFVFVSMWMTWHRAQSHCRKYYTDLAIIQSQSDYDKLAPLTMNLAAWIGLYRDSWKWSDETNTSFINWRTGYPIISGNDPPCGVISSDGLIEDRLCSSPLPFICLTYSKKQIVRVEVKSGQNIFDTAVMTAILQLKLKEHWIEKDTRITWKVQFDGNVFTPKQAENDTVDRNLNQNNCPDLFF